MAGKRGQNSRRANARAERVLTAALQGQPMEQIARKEGISLTAAYRDHRRALERRAEADPELIRAEAQEALRGIALLAQKGFAICATDREPGKGASCLQAAIRAWDLIGQFSGLKEGPQVQIDAGPQFSFNATNFAALMGGQPALASGGSEPIEAVTVEPVQGPEPVRQPGLDNAQEN